MSTPNTDLDKYLHLIVQRTYLEDAALRNTKKALLETFPEIGFKGSILNTTTNEKYVWNKATTLIPTTNQEQLELKELRAQPYKYKLGLIEDNAVLKSTCLNFSVAIKHAEAMELNFDYAMPTANKHIRLSQEEFKRQYPITFSYQEQRKQMSAIGRKLEVIHAKLLPHLATLQDVSTTVNYKDVTFSIQGNIDLQLNPTHPNYAEHQSQLTRLSKAPDKYIKSLDTSTLKQKITPYGQTYKLPTR